MITNLQHLVDKGVIRFFWETYESETEGTHYFYTAVGLGIMASADSVVSIIKDVFEAIEHQHHVYAEFPTAPQDIEERERVLLANNVYMSSPEEFKRILGLNEQSQQQGEFYNEWEKD